MVGPFREVRMIRDRLKAGFRRILGRPSSEPPPPPPAWRDTPAPSSAGSTAVTPPTAAVSPTVTEAAPSTPAPQAPPPGRESAAAEAAPVVDVESAPAESAPASKKKSSKKKVAKSAAVAPAEAVAAAVPPLEVASLTPASSEAAASQAPAATDTVGAPAFSMEQVQELLDEMVRPALQGDGGDIKLVKIEANDIYVRLVGSCQSCPSSVLTMKMGVEALLKEELPGFGSLIQVD